MHIFSIFIAFMSNVYKLPNRYEQNLRCQQLMIMHFSYVLCVGHVRHEVTRLLPTKWNNQLVRHSKYIDLFFFFEYLT